MTEYIFSLMQRGLNLIVAFAPLQIILGLNVIIIIFAVIGGLVKR